MGDHQLIYPAAEQYGIDCHTDRHGTCSDRRHCALPLAGDHPRELLKIRLRHLWYFIGTGVISMALFNWCYFTVIEISQASVAVVLLYTSPIFIMVLSAIFFRERITGRKVLALVLTFAGCVLVAGLIGSSYTLTPKVILLGLSSGLFYGLYSIFGSVALRTYDTRTVTAYTFLFATLGTLPICGVGAMAEQMAAHPVSLFWCVGIALVSTLAPYLLYTWGLSHMSNSRAAILATIEPLVGALLGILAYGEPGQFHEAHWDGIDFRRSHRAEPGRRQGSDSGAGAVRRDKINSKQPDGTHTRDSIGLFFILFRKGEKLVDRR